jgi:hypothetical protein
MEQKQLKRVYPRVSKEDTKDKVAIKIQAIPRGTHRVAHVGASGSRIFTKDLHDVCSILTEYADGDTKWQKCPEDMLTVSVYVLASSDVMFSQDI